jgi:hypothetical protein
MIDPQYEAAPQNRRRRQESRRPHALPIGRYTMLSAPAPVE